MREELGSFVDPNRVEPRIYVSVSFDIGAFFYTINE